jgi:hypothetical protein
MTQRAIIENRHRELLAAIRIALACDLQEYATRLNECDLILGTMDAEQQPIGIE